MDPLALALVAALSTADFEVRNSEVFALAGELGRFPCNSTIRVEYERHADGHLDWLQAQLVMGTPYQATVREAITRQNQVLTAYRTVQYARMNLHLAAISPWADSGDDEDSALYPVGSFESYLIRARENIELLGEYLGGEDYLFGRLPAPLPIYVEKP